MIEDPATASASQRGRPAARPRDSRTAARLHVHRAPRTLAQALAALADPAARILAGGTDLFASLGDRPAAFDIVDITRIAPLAAISTDAGGSVRIGAAATWREVARAPLPAVFDGLRASAREIGSIQIQNTATLAGNLCNASPAADGVPALLALDAAVEIAGAGGSRTLAVGDFVTGPRRTALAPGELVTAIIVPPHPPEAFGAFLKLGARRYLVISIAMVAATIVPDGHGRVATARIAVGACSPVALRLRALEADLAGAPLAQAAERATPSHMTPLSPIGDMRADADYRKTAALELTRRAIRDAARRHGAGA